MKSVEVEYAGMVKPHWGEQKGQEAEVSEVSGVFFFFFEFSLLSLALAIRHTTALHTCTESRGAKI